MGTTYATIKIQHITCHCGVHFGIEKYFYDRVNETGETFFCPKGHACNYTKSENQRLKDELTREKQRLEQAQANTTYYKNATENARAETKCAMYLVRGQKAAKTRLANRIKNGVCPCCTRSFVNVQRHMVTQHPEFNVTEKLA